ncbi:MAG: hypothetical protein J7M10_00545 [Candidatus Cloacimonetes bacterium]|nr:hypothetical protein [Candidatus Cloacimonadota bacterium]
MENKEDKKKKSGWGVGGGTMIGIGVGFFLLPINSLYFVGSIMLGIGLGLIIEAIIKK